MVDVVVGGVQVLRLLAVPHRPGAEAQYASALVCQREHDASPEAVVQPAPLLRALRQARLIQLLLRASSPPRSKQHAIPSTGRVTHAKRFQDLLAQPASLQIRASLGGLPRLPQVALVVGARARQELPQSLATHPPLGFARVLLFDL